MIKCMSKYEFEFKKLKYFLIFGDILVNEKKRIIYLPDDKIYQNIFLNRRIKNEKNKD